MTNIRELIQRHSGGRNVLFFFIAANLVYVLMLFVSIPQVMVYSGGMKLFDMMPMGYDLAYVQTLLQTLGNEGRMIYLTHQLPLDLLYPGLSGIAYCLLMAWLFKKLNLTGKPFAYLCLIPLAAGLFDYLENFGIITMLSFYPGISGLQAGTASACTIIKSMLSATFFVILIVAFFPFLFLKLKNKL